MTDRTKMTFAELRKIASLLDEQPSIHISYAEWMDLKQDREIGNYINFASTTKEPTEFVVDGVTVYITKGMHNR